MTALLFVAVALATAIVITAICRQRKLAQVNALVAKLRESNIVAAPDLSIRDLSSVPAPARRYLELALPPDTRPPWLVTIEQHGELRTSPTGARWMPFAATQTVAPYAHGFVWNAQVAVAPLVHLRVLDSLSDGRGSGQVQLLSAFTVVQDGDTVEMNSGSLLRFLAEAVWYPWALLPSEHLRWTPIDQSRALATLTVSDLTVELEFRFAETGEVAGIYSPGRWGSIGGHYVRMAWEGHFADYSRHGAFLMPRQGEVGWYHDGHLALVWRGTIDHVLTL